MRRQTKKLEEVQREEERRIVAVKICEEGGGTVEIRKVVAKALGVDERTVRRWAQRVREGKPVVEKPGRRPKKAPRSERQSLINEMVRLGPCAGVAVLRAKLPEVSYRLITRMKQRFVRVLQRRHSWYRRKLKWLRAGAVWAMDFTQPKAGMWRGMKKLFVVRDLGSGAQLAAVACKGELAKVSCAVVLALVAAFGAPLVAKHDNGGAFVGEVLQQMLTEHGITPLASPPYTPQYNGSCERSGGTFKQRVDHTALLEGHGGIWRPENVDEAPLLANTTSRPWGATGSTPAEVLERRRAVTPEEREAFKQTRALAIEQALKTFNERTGTMPTCSQRAAIDRKATQHALCEHGYLQIRRGRLSTPILTWKAVTKA